MIVLLDGGTNPLLAMLGEIRVCQQWYGEGDVRLGGGVRLR